MAFIDDKNACLALISAFNCDRVAYIDATLNSYDDVLPVFLANVPKLECYPLYMYSLLACFDIIELNNRGIYFNDPALGAVGDATLIVKCVATTVTVTVAPGVAMDEFVVAGDSVVDELIVTGGGSINSVSSSGGAQIKYLNTTGGSWVNNVRIAACRTFVSSVNSINGSADVRNIFTLRGGLFGGFNCFAPTGVCTDEITLLTAVNVTSHSVIITWTNPVNTIRNIVYYKLTSSWEWLVVSPTNLDNVAGRYLQSALGFAFIGLQPNTYYDFKVVNVCANGHPSPGLKITQLTTP
jgi:hypothetical protein